WTPTKRPNGSGRRGVRSRCACTARGRPCVHYWSHSSLPRRCPPMRMSDLDDSPERARTAFGSRTAALLFGDPRRCSLEQRLFNTISLLNAVANLGGLVRFLDFPREGSLFLLHLVSGLLFLVFYGWSRFRRAYRFLYWPLVLLLAVFLGANILDN